MPRHATPTAAWSLVASLLSSLVPLPPCVSSPSAAWAATIAPSPAIPDLFDPHHRPPKPDVADLKRIRFLTTDDFPPFHFALPDGTLAGFDIDLARAICADLAIACTIQVRPFATLIQQIKDGADDALIAAVADTRATRADLTFTAPYYTTPGRFAVAASSKTATMTPESLAGHAIGVVGGTAYEAYLHAFFGRSTIRPFADKPALQDALAKGGVDAIFGDAIALSLWLNTPGAAGCCAFRGGPFTDSRYFGNGVSIAVARGNVQLREVFDYELAKLAANGTYADLYLKYFPIGFY